MNPLKTLAASFVAAFALSGCNSDEDMQWREANTYRQNAWDVFDMYEHVDGGALKADIAENYETYINQSFSSRNIKSDTLIGPLRKQYVKDTDTLYTEFMLRKSGTITAIYDLPRGVSAMIEFTTDRQEFPYPRQIHHALKQPIYDRMFVMEGEFLENDTSNLHYKKDKRYTEFDKAVDSQNSQMVIFCLEEKNDISLNLFDSNEKLYKVYDSKGLWVRGLKQEASEDDMMPVKDGTYADFLRESKQIIADILGTSAADALIEQKLAFYGVGIDGSKPQPDNNTNTPPDGDPSLYRQAVLPVRQTDLKTAVIL